MNLTVLLPTFKIKRKKNRSPGRGRGRHSVEQSAGTRLLSPRRRNLQSLFPSTATCSAEAEAPTRQRRLWRGAPSRGHLPARIPSPHLRARPTRVGANPILPYRRSGGEWADGNAARLAKPNPPSSSSSFSGCCFGIGTTDPFPSPFLQSFVLISLPPLLDLCGLVHDLEVME